MGGIALGEQQDAREQQQADGGQREQQQADDGQQGALELK